MSTFSVIRYTPDDFVAAVRGHDTTWTNFVLGSLLDSRALDNNGNHIWLPKERVLVGVFKEEKLVIIFTKIEGDHTWSITYPRDVFLSSDDTKHGLATLSSSLTSILSQETTITVATALRLDQVMGPASLVESFIHAWVSHIASSHNVHVKLVDYHLNFEISYVTLATIPPPSSTFSSEKYDIRRTTERDIRELVSLYIEFKNEVWHQPETLEKAVQAVQQATSRERLWFVYYKDTNQPHASKTIAGFVLLGRETPRTIAIRNMFVSPAFRRKGVAEALVRAVTRFYLGAAPLGFELREAEAIHPKEEICLNVKDPGARRLYIRCGFQFEGDQTDAVTGKRKWYPTSVFGVESIDKQ